MNICGKDAHVSGRFVRIAGLAAEGYDFLDDPEAARNALRRAESRIDVLTFIQRLSDGAPRHGYRLEWDNIAALPVSTFEHWWTRQVKDKTRNMVRRAEKRGVVVRELPFDDVLVRGISAIYNESPVRQGRRFWHYGKALDAVRDENATFVGRSVFLGAFFGDALIGFAKVVWDETRGQAGLMKIQSMLDQRDKAPTNALIAQAVRSCADRGISYLWYANFSYGRKQRDGLSEFKEHNGFRAVDVPRYYVPVTLVGHIALRAGLHHRLVDHIPEPALARVRAVRTWWYSRRLSVAAKPA